MGQAIQAQDIRHWSATPVATSVASDGYRVSVHREVAALEAEWVDLEFRAFANAFQTFAWCRAWELACRATGRKEKPFIVSVRQHGRLVLVWPLAERRLGPLRILSSLGDPATQYADLLVERSPNQADRVKLAWKEVTRAAGFDAIVLKGVRADAALATIPELSRDLHLTGAGTAPILDFRFGDHDDIRTPGRSGRAQNALRRQLRKLATQGEVAFSLIEDASGRQAAMQEAIRLKQAWLARSGQVSAGYAHPANEVFLKTLATHPDFVLARLSVGGETAALEAGLRRQGTYWSLVQTYDERFAPQGPGRLLFWMMIERSPSFGIEVFDFLAPTSRHKREWANSEMAVTSAVVPLRVSGYAVLFYARFARPRLKTAARALQRCKGAGRRVLSAMLAGTGVPAPSRAADRGSERGAAETAPGV